MAKPRRQTYTLEMYLKKLKDQDIRSDADVQRLSGQWNNSMASELICSVLNGEYVPPIILGQEENSQAWVVDGLQRSTTLMLFRYGNLRISPNVEEPIIEYRAKVKDKDGNILIDGNGDFVWEGREFDIRRKTYERLPEELKKAFNEYQIDCIIHENYTMQQISRLVRRFNFSKGMNISQRTFTFVDKYARRIREILKRKFFIEAPYTKAERKNGTVERIILETVMCTNHLGDWKKSGQIGAFVNENAAPEEFDSLEDCIARLEEVITDGLYPLFNAKDTFLLFTLFDRFTRLGLPDGKFADFLCAFKDGLCEKEIDGKVFSEIDKNRSTKDKIVIMEKLDLLETLMLEYLGIPKPEESIEAITEQEPEKWTENQGIILPFVRENVSPFTTNEDIEQYMEVLGSLMEKSNCGGKLLEAENKPSLTAIVAYSFAHDIDLDDWIADYCSRNDGYIADQTENYQYMLDDLRQYLENPDATHTDAA